MSLSRSEAEAEAAFEEGKRLYAEGQLEGAIFEFTKAVDGNRGEARYHANLGTAKLAFGCKGYAANDLATALALLGEAREAAPPALKEAFARAAKDAGVVRIRTNVPTAWVVIGRGARLHAVGLERLLYLPQGSHRLQFSARGYDAAERAVSVSVGGRQELQVELARTVRGADSDRALAQPDPAAGGVPWWPAVASGGLALVAVAVGAGLWVAGDSAGDEAGQLVEEGTALTGNTAFCASPQSADLMARCASIQDELARQGTLEDAAVGLFVTGGVLAALAGAVLTAHVLTEPGDTVSTTRFHVVPTFDARGQVGVSVGFTRAF